MRALLPVPGADPAPGPSLLGPEPARLARAAVERLEAEPLDRPTLQTCLEPLIAQLAGYLPVARKALELQPSTAARFSGEHEPEATLAHYRRYDAYFGVDRSEAVTWTEVSAQLVLTSLRWLQDLPGTMLARGQQHAILLGLTSAYTELAGTGTTAPGVPEPLEADVFFRWRNGHHLFALGSLFGRVALERCAASLERLPELIEPAIVHLRLTSSAMAYTTDFPRSLYVDQIRPSLPEGFSGNQNSDYNHFKLAKGKLLKAVILAHGPHTDGWPEPLLAALRRFREIDQLDLDQHILVAAEKVGLGPSLRQRARGEDDSAVRALRRIQADRASEFHLP